MTLSAAKQLWILKRLQSARGLVLREALMKTVEEIGVDRIDEELHQLVPAQHLNTLEAHGDHGISRDLFHELSLLTLGVQLDGSYRVAIGQRAVEAVRSLIENILRERRVKFTWKGRTKTIHFVNAARRSMEIRFASDPDVLVTEYIQGAPRHVLGSPQALAQY
ncbi:MAG: XcyI family restriction endonuclease [Moorellales bacterium]